MGFWDRLLGRDETSAPVEVGADDVASAPTEQDINASLAGVDALVNDPAVPAVVRARALRVTNAVRQTLPRLAILGLGSYDAYSVVATATDYLPEAIGAYLRLPRDWADSRPVENGKTSLLLLIDQLDLLATTMDAIDSFKVEALDTMAATIGTLETEVGKSREYLDRVERQNPQVTSGSLDLGGTRGGGR